MIANLGWQLDYIQNQLKLKLLGVDCILGLWAKMSYFFLKLVHVCEFKATWTLNQSKRETELNAVAHTFNPNTKDFYYFLFLLWTLHMSLTPTIRTLLLNHTLSPQYSPGKMCSLLQAQHNCHGATNCPRTGSQAYSTGGNLQLLL